jgi:L-threonylcarbamoyladenylate synthase
MSNIKPPTTKTLKYAKQLLESWELVAFPTETVYWLWANALDTKAIQKIFDIKKRPSNNPLIVHVWDKDSISKYWIISNIVEKTIIEKLMPGPITILLRKRENIPEIISSNPFVGIRIPSNNQAIQLLQKCGLPIAAPSANISTKPSPTSAKMVYEYFKEQIPLIINGWNCSVGIESTVIKVDEEIRCESMSDWNYQSLYKITIMRPGFITKEDLESIFIKQKNIIVEYSTKITNISPWNMYKHYSPDAQVEIIDCNTETIFKKKIISKIKASPSHKIWLILTQQCITTYQKILNQYKNHVTILPRWSRDDLISCAQKLFDLYYTCDQMDINYILIEYLPENWLWLSIMNRVKKSSEKG